MKSQLLLAFLLFVLAGILGVDRRPAEATAAWIIKWAFEEPDRDGRWNGRHFRMAHNDVMRIEWRYAEGERGYVPLYGVGTFRCRSRAGVLAPYDIVVPLETVDGRLRRAVAQGADTASADRQRISCGLHVTPGQQRPEEFFAEHGTAVLYGGRPDELAGSPTLTLEIYPVTTNPMLENRP